MNDICVYCGKGTTYARKTPWTGLESSTIKIRSWNHGLDGPEIVRCHTCGPQPIKYRLFAEWRYIKRVCRAIYREILFRFFPKERWWNASYRPAASQIQWEKYFAHKTPQPND